jgi:hypothetical protein
MQSYNAVAQCSSNFFFLLVRELGGGSRTDREGVGGGRGIYSKAVVKQ